MFLKFLFLLLLGLKYGPLNLFLLNLLLLIGLSLLLITNLRLFSILYYCLLLLYLSLDCRLLDVTSGNKQCSLAILKGLFLFREILEHVQELLLDVLFLLLTDLGSIVVRSHNDTNGLTSWALFIVEHVNIA